MRNKILAIVIIFNIVFMFEYFQQKLFSQDDKLPSWVKDLIVEQEKGPVANPPVELSKCLYKGKIVYYLPPRCCDIGSILYDENGNHLCSPDGGFTGRGDGKCKDFYGGKNSCEVVWVDHRSYPSDAHFKNTFGNASSETNEIKK